MLYHKRPEITRMSMWHMKKVIDRFNAAGHKAQGIVFGDEEEQKRYAEFLGLDHIRVNNSPLGLKFSFAFDAALYTNCDYICGLGSNNFNDFRYWDQCINALGKNKKVSFGSNKFTIVHSENKYQDTCVFTTRQKKHLCSSGQFYLTYSMNSAINFRSLYRPTQTHNFDGAINDALIAKWGDDGCPVTISSEAFDCFDVKDDTNIHSYDSYMKRSPTIYPKYKKRNKLVNAYKELKLLDQGFFREECYKTFEPEA